MVTCPACNVPITPVESAGHQQCPRCGLNLAPAGAVLGKVPVRHVARDEATDVVMVGKLDDGAAPAPEGRRPPPRFPLAIVAEDLALHRQLLADGLKSMGVCKEVVAADRGDTFLTLATAYFYRSMNPSLAVLDLEMPGLSGYHAAVALRAVERAFDAPQTPVLFFSARPCDEAFRRAMEAVGNAHYLNKAAGNPAQMIDRLVQVLWTFRGEDALVL